MTLAASANTRRSDSDAGPPSDRRFAGIRCGASALLDHSKTALPLDTYSHVIPDMIDRAADRLERIISEGRQSAQREA